MIDETVNNIIQNSLEGAIEGAVGGLISPYTFMFKIIKFITQSDSKLNKDDMLAHYHKICHSNSIPVVEDEYYEEIIDEILDDDIIE